MDVCLSKHRVSSDEHDLHSLILKKLLRNLIKARHSEVRLPFDTSISAASPAGKELKPKEGVQPWAGLQFCFKFGPLLYICTCYKGICFEMFTTV